MEQIRVKVLFLYNFQMTTLVQQKILKHYNSLKMMGFEYAAALKTDEFNNNDMSLPNNLIDLQALVENCSLCEFSKYKTSTVFSEGNIHSPIVFVDVMPSIVQEANNRLLVGKSGELLIKMIENVLNVSYNQFYFANIIKCKTSTKKVPTPHEINCCKPFLAKQLELISPKLIIALGEMSYEYLTNDKRNIEQVRGKITKYNHIDVLPIYHPSFLLRNPSAKKEAFHDMLKIKSLMESM